MRQELRINTDRDLGPNFGPRVGPEMFISRVPDVENQVKSVGKKRVSTISKNHEYSLVLTKERCGCQ